MGDESYSDLIRRRCRGTPTSYEDALSIMVTRKRRLERDVRIDWYDKEGGDISIYYYRTPIVTFHRNGMATLRDGGYRTASTRNKINEYMGRWTRNDFCLYNHLWTWYVKTASGLYHFKDDMKVSAAFYGRIAYNPDGTPMELADEKADEREYRQKRRRYRQFRCKGACRSMFPRYQMHLYKSKLHCIRCVPRDINEPNLT